MKSKTDRLVDDVK